MKGIILCAGRGTRMQPFSSFLPKTLCPVANQPILEYCIQKLVEVNIRQVAVVLNHDQDQIKKFLYNYSTEVQFELVYQDEPKGIADAVKMTEPFIAGDSFIVLLGDNLIVESLHAFLGEFDGHDSVVMLSHVEDPTEYGIAELQEARIVHLEEKPTAPKSNLAVVGIYGFSPVIFKAIASIQPSSRGEYEITDAIQWLIDNEYPVSYSLATEYVMDVGTIGRWLSANQWILQQKYGETTVIGNDVEMKNCVLRGPVVIGDNCVLRDATIGPYVSIQSESTLVDCTIERSICLEKCTIAHVPELISDSVFGRESILELSSKGSSSIRYVLSDRSEIVAG